MSVENLNQDAWSACPSGELNRVVGRIGHHHRRRVLTQIAAVAVVVLLGGVTAWQFFPSKHDFSYGQITCSEIQAGLQQYLAHQLPDSRAEQFRLHLEQCPRCKELVDQMMSETDQSAVLASGSPLRRRSARNTAGRIVLAAGSTAILTAARPARTP